MKLKQLISELQEIDKEHGGDLEANIGYESIYRSIKSVETDSEDEKVIIADITLPPKSTK